MTNNPAPQPDAAFLEALDELITAAEEYGESTDASGCPKGDFFSVVKAREDVIAARDQVWKDVLHLYLCESRSLVLHPERLYMFHKHPDCERCNQ